MLSTDTAACDCPGPLTELPASPTLLTPAPCRHAAVFISFSSSSHFFFTLHEGTSKCRRGCAGAPPHAHTHARTNTHTHTHALPQCPRADFEQLVRLGESRTRARIVTGSPSPSPSPRRHGRLRGPPGGLRAALRPGRGAGRAGFIGPRRRAGCARP